MKKLLELNLIKESLVKQKSMLKALGLIRRGYIFCFAAFMGLVIVAIAVEMRCSQFRAKTASIKKNITAERKEFGMEQLETEWRGYVESMAQIENNFAKRTSLGAMITALSRSLPFNARVASFSADMKSGVNVKMDLLINEKGQSSMESVIGFLDTLKKNPLFGEHIKVDSQEKITSPTGHGTETDTMELYKISIMR